MIKRCPSGKVRFKDRIAADLALAGAVGDKGSVRTYECPLCNGWHSTSKPKREAS